MLFAEVKTISSQAKEDLIKKHEHSAFTPKLQLISLKKEAQLKVSVIPISEWSYLRNLFVDISYHFLPSSRPLLNGYTTFVGPFRYFLIALETVSPGM